MAYRSAEEFVDAYKADIEKATKEREERIDATIADRKKEVGYDDMSDIEKEKFDEWSENYKDRAMGNYHPDHEKRESTEEDSHEQREIER